MKTDRAGKTGRADKSGGAGKQVEPLCQRRLCGEEE